MPFIEMPLGDVKEGEPVPEANYDLRITSAQDATSEAGNHMVVCRIKVEDKDYPNAPLIRQNLVIPKPDHPYREFMWLQNKRFLHAFGVPYTDTGFDSDDLEGATANILVVVGEADDQGNTYNELRPGRLPKGDDKATAPRSSAASRSSARTK